MTGNTAPKLHDSEAFWNAVCEWTRKYHGWLPAKCQTDELLAALAPPSGEGVDAVVARACGVYDGAMIRLHGEESICNSDAMREVIEACAPKCTRFDCPCEMQIADCRYKSATPQSAPVDVIGPNEVVVHREILENADAALSISNHKGSAWSEHESPRYEIRELLGLPYEKRTTPPPASQESGVIGEIISSAYSPSGMNIVRWAEGFLPKVGMKLFASEHKHDLVHNVETDIVTCRGCDYLSPPSSAAAAKEPEQRCPYCAGLIYSNAGCQNCKVGSVWPKPIAAEQDSSAAEESSNGEPAVPASTVRQQDDVCQDTSLEASPKRQVANPVLSTSVRGLTGHHDFPPVPPIRAAEQAKPNDCPFCGREGKHYGEEVCPGLNKPSTFTLAEQAQAGELQEEIQWALNGLPQLAINLRFEGQTSRADTVERIVAILRRLAGGVTVDESMRERFKVAFHSRPNETRTYDEALHDALVAALGAK